MCLDCGVTAPFHHRRCPTVVDAHTERLWQMADALEDLAASLPIHLATEAWCLAEMLRHHAGQEPTP